MGNESEGVMDKDKEAAEQREREHGEVGPRCELCEDGHMTWCALCLRWTSTCCCDYGTCACS